MMRNLVKISINMVVAAESRLRRINLVITALRCEEKCGAGTRGRGMERHINADHADAVLPNIVYASFQTRLIK